MTNSDRLQEIREREQAATPGPWETSPIKRPYWTSICLPNHPVIPGLVIADARPKEAEFIAASREDIPWLLQHITEQENEITWLRTWIFRLHDPETAAQKIHKLAEEPMTIEQVREFLGIQSDPGSAFGTPGIPDWEDNGKMDERMAERMAELEKRAEAYRRDPEMQRQINASMARAALRRFASGHDSIEALRTRVKEITARPESEPHTIWNAQNFLEQVEAALEAKE